jgi:hypothetical protein
VLRRLLRNRLLQFAVIGALLYALAARGKKNVVDLDPAVLASLEEAQTRKLGLSALPEEGKREVGARAIEDEILYREAIRLGLDQDDPILKQRLVQKLLILVEDLGGASRDPTDEELRAHYERTRARWKKPARYSIVQVFAQAATALPDASALAGAIEPPALGDPFPYKM